MSDTRYCPKCGESCGWEDRFCGSCRAELRPMTPRPGFTPRSRDSLDGMPTELGLLPNSILMNRYRIVREIGSGGMGLVYEAEDEKLKMRVAIKVMREILSRDPGSVSRLIAEAKHSMVLSDLNIVRVHNFEDDTTVKFLVMEYVEGGTLAELLAKQGKLTEEDTRRLAVEICKGLQHAHDRKIFHRDLKPANILIGKDGTVKIADFGIARACRDSMTRLTSQADSGTLLYMAPEQLDGETSAATDLYSVGVVLYEMLSGNPPFHTGFIPDQIRRIVPKPIAGISEAMNRTVLKCLEKNPAGRFATAGELRQELDGTAAQRRARHEQAESEQRRAEEKEAGRRVTEAKRPATERLVAEGLRLSEEGKLTEAEAVLRQALEADRSNPQVWDALSSCREKRGASEQRAAETAQAEPAAASVKEQAALPAATVEGESPQEIASAPVSRKFRWRLPVAALLTISAVVTFVIFVQHWQDQRERREALDRGWWQDPGTNLIWAAKDLEPQSWDDANESCQNLDVGGYQGFRLPTVEELAALRDPKMPNQMRGPFTAAGSSFWSSTPDKKLAGTADIFGTYDHPTPRQYGLNQAYSCFLLSDGTRSASLISSGSRHGALCVRSPGPQAPGAKASAWLDTQTGLVWTTQESGRDRSMPFWGAANAYCGSLHVDGYANWRLPTIDELQGLFDTRQPNHMRGPFRVSFPSVWSGTFVDNNKAWIFGFREGQRHSMPADAPYIRALCVRPGIWTDPQTKLMWTAKEDEWRASWKEADSYCRNLTLAGYGGWRMPTIDELAALYDPGIKMRGPLKPESYPAHGVWSSTAKEKNEYWSFSFFDGRRSSMTADFPLGASTVRSLCVRPSDGASDVQRAGGSPGAAVARAETVSPAPGAADKPKNYWEDPPDDPFGGAGGFIRPAAPKGK